MQRLAPLRGATRSFRDARPPVPRPLPRRRRDRAWPRVLSSLILVAALATLLLKAAPLLTARHQAPLALTTLFSPRIARSATQTPRPARPMRLTIAAGAHTWRLMPADLVTLRREATPGRVAAIDHTAVTAYVARHAAALDRPGRDAAVLYSGGVVRVIEGQAGQVVDRAAAAARLTAALDHGETASIVWPLVPSSTVTNAEASRAAGQLRRTLRTTVVWLPRRHWAIPPAAIASMLTLRRDVTPAGVRLVASLDSAALAAHLPGSEALVHVPARNAAVVERQGRYVVIPAVEGHAANYAALAAEMLRSPTPPGRAVYHLPISSLDPAVTTAAAQQLAAQRNQKHP